MATDSTIRVGYIFGHLITALVSATVGYWTVYRTEMRARHLYGVYALSNVIWSLISAATVAVPAGPTLSTLWAVWSTVPICSALCLVAFASEFTGRDWRQNRIFRGLTVVAAIFIPFVLTSPYHDLYRHSVTVVTEPFAHLDYSYGIVGIGVILLILASFSVTYYYFIELYFKSRHRPSSAMIVIVAGFLFGLCPFVLSRLDVGLVSTYDHTSFGIIPAALSFAFAAFRLELADVTPLARDDAIENLSDPYLAIDDTGTLVDHNHAAKTLLDISDRDIGNQVADVAPTVSTAIDNDQEELTVSADGTDRHFDLNVSAIIGPVDDHRGTQVLMRDVTARTERKQELQRQNERLDQFASMISHDLRNPLGIAEMYVDFAEESGNKEDFQAVRESLTRMDTMIDDLLTMARSETTVTETESVTIEAVATDAWATAQTDGATLEINGGDASIDAAPDLLQNVFENLFRNAVDHNDPPVTLRVGTLDSTDGFYVEDDGSGIPDDERADIFDYGYTTNEEGSGFGLAIVKELITAHDWTVSVTEGSDGGARFEIFTDESAPEAESSSI